MIFDVYYPFYSQKKQGLVPGIKPVPMEYSRIKNEVLSSQTVRIAIEKHRAGEPDQKITLPSICFVGHCTSTRKNAAMIPTQFVMIDIDHVKDPNQAWEAFKTLMTWDWICDNVLLAHLTPSRGIHIYFRAQEGLTTLQENMNWLNDQVNFGQWGDYDSVVHDFARISFAFLADEILFENTYPPSVLLKSALNSSKNLRKHLSSRFL